MHPWSRRASYLMLPSAEVRKLGALDCLTKHQIGYGSATLKRAATIALHRMRPSSTTGLYESTPSVSKLCVCLDFDASRSLTGILQRLMHKYAPPGTGNVSPVTRA
ncbi:unnamed protein product [Mycena citricolor]|uniref:Uncharacterized protein n=1 Tax=Mycena citricolor TaxID=2018698 RepID=A0AAD2GVZ6_9AGAR|nr:unnamed protein product [Mycena citricolor]